MRTILLYISLLSCTILFSQETKIEVSPKTMLGTSSIVTRVAEKGNYTLQIVNQKDKVLFEKKIFIEKVHVMKHRFTQYPKGTYSFILLKDNKINHKKVIKKTYYEK